MATGPEHYREAERLLALAAEIPAHNDETNPAAALTIAEAQVYATLALAAAQQPTPAELDSTGGELAALRRIIAAHIHATLTTATGPIRKVLTDHLVSPLLAALDDAGIDLTAELTAIGVNLPAQRDGAEG